MRTNEPDTWYTLTAPMIFIAPPSQKLLVSQIRGKFTKSSRTCDQKSRYLLPVHRLPVRSRTYTSGICCFVIRGDLCTSMIRVSSTLKIDAGQQSGAKGISDTCYCCTYMAFISIWWCFYCGSRPKKLQLANFKSAVDVAFFVFFFYCEPVYINVEYGKQIC